MSDTTTAALEKLAGEPAGRFTRHRSGMLLLDELLGATRTSSECSWSPPESHPIFRGDDGFPSYLAIECMAQCVAVHAGVMASLRNQGPPLGLLLGTRRFKAAVTHLQAGTEYRVSCRELLRDSQGLASFECEIRNETMKIASCRLAVYEYAEESNEPS